jgi:hypothetical protein
MLNGEKIKFQGTLKVEGFMSFVLSTVLFLSLSSMFTIQEGQDWASPYIEWVKSYEIYGLVQGYNNIQDVYPPGVYSILSAFQVFSTDYYFNHKLAQAICFTLASGIAYYATKRMSHVLVFQGSVVVSQIIFSSVDIFYMPFLIAAFALGKKSKFVLSAAMFSLALLTKWQVVFLVPFIGIFLIIKYFKRNNVLEYVLIISVTLLIWTVAVVVFGDDFIAKLFHAGATSSTRLSAFTFNAGWILSFIISGWSVHDVSALPGSFFVRLMQGVFALIFIMILLRTAYSLYKKPEISFQDIMVPMTLAFGAFLVIYPGIHSNYWITLSALLLFLCNSHIGYLLFCYIGVMASINLLFVRNVLRTHDNIFLFGYGNEASIVFSLLNVLILVLGLYYYFSIKAR